MEIWSCPSPSFSRIQGLFPLMSKSLILSVLSIAAALSVACSPGPSFVRPEDFDSELDGGKTALYLIKGGDLAMQVTNYGCRVVTLFVPDRDGKPVDVVLGHDRLDEYVNYGKERFLGAVVGPVANRICGASFRIGDTVYHLEKSHEGVGTLHGGFKGLDSVVWDLEEKTDSSITFHYLHADGQEGFPGNLDIHLKYALTSDDSWTVSYRATTDKTTPVNITCHPYFNLSGEPGTTCEDYVLYVNGRHIIGIDGLDVIETPIPVEGTAFDYLEPHPARDAIHGDDGQIVRGNHGFDHNYVLDKAPGELALDATVYDPHSGIFLEVYSDQPGLQVYSGQYFTGEELGKGGAPLVKYGSITFETQNFPDAPNRKSFPDPFLNPGELYSHECVYHFSTN